MDILKKLDKMQNKIDSDKKSPIPAPIFAGYYPGNYEDMSDLLLCSYFELACDEYKEAYDALEEITKEIKKRKISVDFES